MDSEYWNRSHFKMTLDAVQALDEEPLVGRTPLVEGNHQREFGGWYRLPSWSTGAKIVDHSSAGIAPVSSNRLPNRTSAGSL
ncbi:MAG: hypothetical protein WB766_08675 [Roseiarcus sp.]